jgi:3-oxoacyl-[acyl-carrier-protein] synthase II
MRRRVVVTGLGAVTPLGVGARAAWGALVAGRSGIVNVERARPFPGMWTGIPSLVAGVVPWRAAAEGAEDAAAADDAPFSAGGDGDGDPRAPAPTWWVDDWLARPARKDMALHAQYGAAAAEMALADAGWRPRSDAERDSTGVCIGTGIGNLADVFSASVAFYNNAPAGASVCGGGGDVLGGGGLSASPPSQTPIHPLTVLSQSYKKITPTFVPRILSNMAAGHVSMLHGLRGPNHAATTACTTGAHSIGDAARFIAHGDADAMLAGGTEACIHPLALAGFSRARSLSTRHNASPERSSAPFDAARDGFVVAEGAAVLLLEDLAHARARGARVYAELRGYGCSADAHHMTAPRADGAGAVLAMKKALADAGVRPAQVDYVNAHATGTRAGDVAEARALQALMAGEHGHASEAEVTVSSTKGATGHLLGAAGALEALFSVLAIHEVSWGDDYRRRRSVGLSPPEESRLARH